MARLSHFGGRVPGELLRRRPIETFFIREWSGGWQPSISEPQLAPNMIPDLLNVEFDLAGAVTKRRGFVKQTDDVAGLDNGQHLWALGTNAVIGSTTLIDPSQLIIYENEDDGSIFYQTTAKLLASPNTDLVDSTRSMGSVKGVASNLNPEDEYGLSAFIFNDIAYITGHRLGGDDAGVFTNSTEDGTSAGGTKPLKFTITTNTWARADVPDFTAAGTVTGVPRAATALPLHDRVFYGNVTKQNVFDYPNRIYFSEPGTAETFDVNNYVTIGSDDGQQIRKLIPLGSQIIALKEGSTWALVGTDDDTFAVYNLSGVYGTHSVNAAVVFKNKLFFLDIHSGVVSYDGAGFDIVSTEINGELLTDLNRAAVFKACAFVDVVDERLYLSVPVGEVAAGITDRPTRTYVYDFRLKVWTKWDYGFTAAVRISPTYTPPTPAVTDGPIWTVNNDGALGVFEINSGYNDGGIAYNSFFETIWFNPSDDVGDKHRIRRLDVTAEPDGFNVAVSLYRNFDGTTAWKTATMTPTGTLDGWHEMEAQHDTEMWSWLKLKFENNTINQSFKIHGVGMSFSTRRILRGELRGLNQ